MNPDTQIERDVADEPKAADVKQRIEQALARNATADAERIRIETHDGTVTLRGTVRFWAERDEAVRAAWAVPGVIDVIDELVIAY
jgi:osmotically-inducible protein OsmY